uniref:Uncharacterized protein n=1 Tax=Arundo donax TaxID=35708 RepID=A0A0A8ZJ95_ARUDO
MALPLDLATGILHVGNSPSSFFFFFFFARNLLINSSK